jgi:hypothetical protein
MKTKIFYLTLIFGLLVGCEKNEDNPVNENSNYLEINNVKYDLHKGGLEYYNYAPDEYYNYNLHFTSNDNSTTIQFDIWASQSVFIEDGDYHFNDSKQPKTFEWGSYVTGWYEGFDEENEWPELQNGTISVKKTGTNEYEISFVCVGDNSVAIKGYYKGNINYTTINID